MGEENTKRGPTEDRRKPCHKERTPQNGPLRSPTCDTGGAGIRQLGRRCRCSPGSGAPVDEAVHESLDGPH
eukprot:12927038-Prorocentrum_lima.AAC.1